MGCLSKRLRQKVNLVLTKMLKKTRLEQAIFQQHDALGFSYRIPGIPACYLICHQTLRSDVATMPAEFIQFVWQQARGFAQAQGLHRESYIISQNGMALGQNEFLHFHIFIVKNRWQRASLYALLMLRQIALGLRQTWQS